MFVYQSVVVYDIMLLVTRFSRCGACQLLHVLQDSVRKYGVPGNRQRGTTGIRKKRRKSKGVLAM